MVAWSGNHHLRGSDRKCLHRSNVVMRTTRKDSNTPQPGCATTSTTTPHSKPRPCQPESLSPRWRSRRPLANLTHRYRTAGPTGYDSHLKGSTDMQKGSLRTA
ncbi:hypothetical protein MRX96_055552 [Rhipicephalus microplus]